MRAELRSARVFWKDWWADSRLPEMAVESKIQVAWELVYMGAMLEILQISTQLFVIGCVLFIYTYTWSIYRYW